MRLAAAVVMLLALQTAAHADGLKVGDRAKELDRGSDSAGKAVKLGAYRGKWIVVTIGAEWCKPCKKELPTYDKLAAAMKGKVTFIALDVTEDTDVGKANHKKLGLKNMVLVYLGGQSSVAETYGGETMPSTYIISPDGVVKWAHGSYNAGDEKKLSDELGKLVK